VRERALDVDERLALVDIGSEKRADQASPFLCSWDVMVLGQ
jgi:hypothetical protein